MIRCTVASDAKLHNCCCFGEYFAEDVPRQFIARQWEPLSVRTKVICQSGVPLPFEPVKTVDECIRILGGLDINVVLWQKAFSITRLCSNFVT